MNRNQRQHWIERRAYEIWQSEGSPEGRAAIHWHLAVEELCEANRGAPTETRLDSRPEHVVPAETAKPFAASDDTRVGGTGLT